MELRDNRVFFSSDNLGGGVALHGIGLAIPHGRRVLGISRRLQ